MMTKARPMIIALKDISPSLTRISAGPFNDTARLTIYNRAINVNTMGMALTLTVIVDLRINETLQTGAVTNRTYRAG